MFPIRRRHPPMTPSSPTSRPGVSQRDRRSSTDLGTAACSQGSRRTAPCSCGREIVMRVATSASASDEPLGRLGRHQGRRGLPSWRERATLDGVDALDIQRVMAIIVAEQDQTARRVAALEGIVADIVEGSELTSTVTSMIPRARPSRKSGPRREHCCDRRAPTATRSSPLAGSSSRTDAWRARSVVATSTSSASRRSRRPPVAPDARPDRRWRAVVGRRRRPVSNPWTASPRDVAAHVSARSAPERLMSARAAGDVQITRRRSGRRRSSRRGRRRRTRGGG